MIRPLTCLAFLLACGSGLYVYQTKHRVKVLDDQITQTIKSTDALREQTRMLSAEWTLLNDPERLRQLANQFLTLQTVSPNQFISLADLDSRLPPPAPPVPPPGTAADVVVAASSMPAAVASNGASRTGTDEGKPADANPADTRLADTRLADTRPADTRLADTRPGDTRLADTRLGDAKPSDARLADGRLADAPSPVSPKDAASLAAHGAALPGSPQTPHVTVTASTDPAHVPDNKPAAPHAAPGASPPRPIAGQTRPPEPRVQEPMIAEARQVAPPLHVLSPPHAPSPQPMWQPASQASGSLLGMAHGMSAPPAPMPLPRPMPISVPQWSSGAGG